MGGEGATPLQSEQETLLPSLSRELVVYTEPGLRNHGQLEFCLIKSYFKGTGGDSLGWKSLCQVFFIFIFFTCCILI